MPWNATPRRFATVGVLLASADLLALVAAGAGTLTKEQREWCVGEAMVLTGFQFTPVELIEKGDAAVARMILDARKG